MADNAGFGHEGFQVLVRHGPNAVGLETMKDLFKRRPFTRHHGMFQPGAKDAQGHERKIAVIGNCLEVAVGLGVGQPRPQPGRPAVACLGRRQNFCKCRLGDSLA